MARMIDGSTRLGRCHTFWRCLIVVLAAIPAATAPADDHGDGPESATLLAIGETVAGEVGTEDVDVFRLDLHGSDGFETGTIGQTDTTGELVTGSGVLVATDEDSGSGTNFRIEAELSAGVYYLAVSGDPGPYAVNARLAGRSDHGDTPATSSLLPVRTAAELEAAEPNILLATSGRIHPTTQDVDVFRLDVGREGAIVVRSSPNDLDLDGVLIGADGATVAEDDAERRLPNRPQAPGRNLLPRSDRRDGGRVPDTRARRRLWDGHGGLGDRSCARAPACSRRGPATGIRFGR
ncbi:MAG: hypothetical protein OXH15_13920 [Gammaproteobacteria bacterium]|nr:hypothetical protein [Gammaproteobacteria bacterium]